MSREGLARAVAAAVGMTIAARLLAQAQVADALVFTAVAIKPNTSGSGRSNVDLQPGGRFVAINVGVLQMVIIAYGDDGPLTQDRLVVNDKWSERRAVTSAKYDIQATAERDISQPDLQHALRQLLSDRFKLTMHRQTRQVPSYELVFARADSRLGPRLRPSSADCTQAEACGFQSFPGRAKGRVTMGDLARRVLPAGVGDGRPILDRTGLTGTFEFDLEWTPDAAAPPRPPDAPPAPPIDPNGSSFVTALREQLGLKLEARSGSIDLVVVDHAERPLPD